MKLLKGRGVPFRVICVLSSDSLESPEELIDFFIDHDVEHVGFNLETIEGSNVTSSLSDKHGPKLRNFWLRVLRRIAERRSRISIREVDWAVEFVLSAENRERRRRDNTPLSMLTVDVDGNYYTFSPELAGLRDVTGQTYAIASVREGKLASVTTSERFVRLVAEVQAGIEMCRSNCRHFGVCGGGSPSNKLAENGTFVSGETLGCRLETQVLFDTLSELVPEVADAIKLHRSREPSFDHSR
jgi:uncharacterized protein